MPLSATICARLCSILFGAAGVCVCCVRGGGRMHAWYSTYMLDTPQVPARNRGGWGAGPGRMLLGRRRPGVVRSDLATVHVFWDERDHDVPLHGGRHHRLSALFLLPQGPRQLAPEYPMADGGVLGRLPDRAADGSVAQPVCLWLVRRVYRVLDGRRVGHVRQRDLHKALTKIERKSGPKKPPQPKGEKKNWWLCGWQTCAGNGPVE